MAPVPTRRGRVDVDARRAGWALMPSRSNGRREKRREFGAAARAADLGHRISLCE